MLDDVEAGFREDRLRVAFARELAKIDRRGVLEQGFEDAEGWVGNQAEMASG